MKLPAEYKLREFELIMSWDCNLHCKYCYEQADRAKATQGTFSAENTKKLINFILETHDQAAPEIRIVFFGGEPLLFFDKLKEITESLKKEFVEKYPEKKLLFSITTNLTLPDRPQLDYLLANGFSFMVSLDGKKESHDLNRGEGSFFAAVGRLSYLYAKQASVKLRATINKNNIKDFKSNIIFLNSLGFPFSWVFDYSETYTPEELQFFLKELHDFYTNTLAINDQTIDEYIARKDKQKFCIDPYQTISVRYDGKLIICSGVNNVIGSLAEGVTEYDGVKMLYFYNNNPEEECRKCLSFEYCLGGCLSARCMPKEDKNYPLNKNFCDIQQLLNIFINEREIIKTLI